MLTVFSKVMLLHLLLFLLLQIRNGMAFSISGSNLSIPKDPDHSLSQQNIFASYRLSVVKYRQAKINQSFYRMLKTSFTTLRQYEY